MIARNMLAGAIVATALVLAGTAAQAATFTILIFETKADLALRTAQSAEGKAYWEGYGTLFKEMADAGIMRGGSALTGSETASVIEPQADKPVIRAGAFQSGEKSLSGYFSIEVPSMADASAWAGKIPAAKTGAVEIRQNFDAPGMK